MKIKDWAVFCFALGSFLAIAIYAISFFGWAPPIFGVKMYARLIICAFAISFGLFCAGVFAFKARIEDAQSCVPYIGFIITLSIIILMDWLLPLH